jgi:hypothetical protein
MIHHIQYLWYVLRHKWFVFVECCRLGIPIRGVLHDLSKFRPREWFAYASYFYGEKITDPSKLTTVDGKLVPLKQPPADVRDAFDVALNHHYKSNPHHWQYWLLTPDKPRPNFGLTSHDGGMTHVYIQRFSDGKDAAIVWDSSIDWHKPEYELESDLGRTLRNTPVALDMPMNARKEMLADWIGAGRAAGKSNTRAWYLSQRNDITLHPNTRAWIEDQLGVSNVA